MMADFIRRHNLSLTSLVLLVLATQLMNYSVANPELPRSGSKIIVNLINPLEKSYYSVSNSISSYWNDYFYLVDVEQKRQVLADRVKILEAQNSHLTELESENARLKKLLNFASKTNLVPLSATVIGRDPSNWIKTITIDRGSHDGLRPGLAVVDGNAIVGQTTVVTKNSSKVLLITDSRSAVDVIVQGSRASAVAVGSSKGQLALEYLSKESPVNVGDRVVASGLDQIFPKGTIVGVVTSVKNPKTGLFQKATVRPAGTLDRLETILALVPREDSIRGNTLYLNKKKKKKVSKKKKEELLTESAEKPKEQVR